MKISRTHPMTGHSTERDLPVTSEQLEAWKKGTLIQIAMPHLSPSDREWLQTGLTDEDFEAMRLASETDA